MMWEMVVRVIRGKYERPYSEFLELMYDFQIIVQTSKGKRCTIPPTCPPSVARLIQLCWSPEPEMRPETSELIVEIQKLQREYRNNKDEWDNSIVATDDSITPSGVEPAAKGHRRNPSTSSIPDESLPIPGQDSFEALMGSSGSDTYDT